MPYVSLSSIFKAKITVNYKSIGKEVSIISSNVLQKNNEYSKLLELVKNIKPDILLTIETNKAWENALLEVEDNFLYNYKIALENRYGMHLYTKLEAIEIKEHFFYRTKFLL